MPETKIEIIDWGKPGAPMVIHIAGKAVTLEIHIIANKVLDRLADYAGRCQEPREFHLGFFGYLRVCDALCTERTGVSIMDIADVNWRDFYDDRLPPHEAIDRELRENGYQI
jgi:hypothetical protein